LLILLLDYIYYWIFLYIFFIMPRHGTIEELSIIPVIYFWLRPSLGNDIYSFG
jgi:hypothetical protein